MLLLECASRDVKLRCDDGSFIDDIVIDRNRTI